MARQDFSSVRSASSAMADSAFAAAGDRELRARRGQALRHAEADAAVAARDARGPALQVE
jgi:hypothetical protein